MENLNENIISVDCSENAFTVKYENDSSEELTKTVETYKKLYDTFIVPLPVFISDKYKSELRSLSFAALQKNSKCIVELDNLFSDNNKAQLFLTYLRTRKPIIEKDKLQWVRK